jgi:pimeloyl-ACP methyl ester carboxylesterase
MSALRVELFFDEEAGDWHYRVPALRINGGGTGARLCCCAASRVRHRAGCRLLACCPRRPAWCGAGPAGHEASRRLAGGFASSARAVLAELEARGAARAVSAGRCYGGGVALPAAGLAPERAGALVLRASAGPGRLSGGGRLLAAPVAAGQVCARRRAGGFRWLARARLAAGYGRAYARWLPIGSLTIKFNIEKYI